MGSSRLPGKSMVDICGRPLIQHIIERLKRCETFSGIILLTSTRQENDILERLAVDLGIGVLRGNEDDVLSRFVAALKKYDPRHVIRVCADNPLIDPREVDRIVRHHLASGADYSFNHIPALDNSYPDGVGAEILTAGALSRIFSKTSRAEDHEHVTKYIWDHPDDFDIRTIPAPPEIAMPDVRLDVDTPEDLEKIRRIYSHFDSYNFSTREVLACIKVLKI
jgi:spore coat polysaccharide biosynthesis protein SpsF